MIGVQGKGSTRVESYANPTYQEFYLSPMRIGNDWQVVGYLLLVDLFLAHKSVGNWILEGDPKPDLGSVLTPYLNPRLYN